MHGLRRRAQREGGVPEAHKRSSRVMTRRDSARDTMSVEEILRRIPRAARVFLKVGTQCVGCPMSKFCTPTDVAANYGLDRKAFLHALHLGHTFPASAR